MTKDSVRFALVGAGFIGRVIADTLTLVDGADLRLVVARSERSARPVAAAHKARWSTDLNGYLETADDVDVVIVTTPSGTHADIAVPALQAGKHVFIEKPLDITLEAVDRIIAAEQASGNMVGVVSQHRFDRSSKRVLDAIARGGLGRLTSARASCAWWRGQSYYDSSEWRGTWLGDGGGATMNQAIHIIDLMVAAMGEPVKVFACTATLAHERIEVEDTAVAVVRFASGALGTIHATTAAYPGLGLLLAIHGDGGSAAIIDEELSFLHATDGAAPPIEMSDSGIPYNQVGPKDQLDPWSEPSAWRTPSSYGTSSSPYGLAVTVIQTPARASARPTGAGSSPSSSACTSPQHRPVRTAHVIEHPTTPDPRRSSGPRHRSRPGSADGRVRAKVVGVLRGGRRTSRTISVTPDWIPGRQELRVGNLPPCRVLGVPTSVWDLSGIMFHQYEPRRGSGASAGLVSGRRLGPVSIAGTRPRVPGDGCLETISAFDLPPDGMVDERAPKRRAPEGLDIQRSDVDGDLDPVQPWVVEADGAAVVAGVHAVVLKAFAKSAGPGVHGPVVE